MANEEEVKRRFLGRHPELDVIANWGIIRTGIGHSPVTVENAEQSAMANRSSLAVISPEELQADQVRFADAICVGQFQRKFKPSEANHGERNFMRWLEKDDIVIWFESRDGSEGFV